MEQGQLEGGAAEGCRWCWWWCWVVQVPVVPSGDEWCGWVPVVWVVGVLPGGWRSTGESGSGAAGGVGWCWWQCGGVSAVWRGAGGTKLPARSCSRCVGVRVVWVGRGGTAVAPVSARSLAGAAPVEFGPPRGHRWCQVVAGRTGECRAVQGGVGSRQGQTRFGQ